MPYVRVPGRWVKVVVIPSSYLDMNLGILENRVMISDYALEHNVEELNCITLARRLGMRDGNIGMYKTGTILGDNREPLISLTRD